MGGLSKKRIEDALRKNRGVISATADSLNVTRQTIHNRLNKDEKLKQLQEEERYGIVDLAESKLIANIEAGLEKSVIYALNTLGRTRGYGARVIVSDQSTMDDAIDGMSDEELLEKLKERTRKITDAAK